MHPNKWAEGLCKDESDFVRTGNLRPGMEERNTPAPTACQQNWVFRPPHTPDT